MDQAADVDGGGASLRDALREGLVDVLPILAGMVPFGLVVGVASVEAGIGLEGAVTTSVLMFAGASQLAAIDLLGRDAQLLVVVLTATVINLRFAMYSAALAPVLGREPRWARAAGAYLLVDQVFALTVTRANQHPTRTHRMGYYAGVALPLWVNWQLLTVIGAVVGAAIPAWLPLEATIPLVFLALLVPAVTDRATLAAAVVGGLVATVGMNLPNNTGLLLGATSGIGAGTVVAIVAGRDART